MPKRPECTGTDQRDTLWISVYRQKGQNSRNYGKLYLRWDNLDWLLSYAADQLHFQSVPVLEPEPTDEKTGNCSEVADVRTGSRMSTGRTQER